MYFRNIGSAALLSALTLIGASALFAVTTEQNILKGYTTFSEMEIKNLSLSNEGILEAGPSLGLVADLDEPVVWAALQEANGNLILGTGNEGKVLRVSPDGTRTTLFESGDLLVRALAKDAVGNLYVGTSPTGRIYKVTTSGNVEFFCAPKSSYLWALTISSDNFLYVATGNPGAIYKIPLDQPPAGEIAPWYSATQDHITSLAWTNAGELVFGTSPGGILYRINSDGKTFALHDSGAEELKNIITQADGSILFSTFNEQSTRNRRNNRAGQNQTVTVQVRPASNYYNDEEDAPPPPPPQPQSGNQNTAPASTARSEIYKLTPEGFVETIAISNSGGIHGLAILPNGEWLAGTDNKGKIYRGESIYDFSLLQQTPKGGQVSLLLPDNSTAGAYYVITSNPAAIYRLDVSSVAQGNLTTNVIDAFQSAQWGTVELLGHALPFEPSLRFRFGNTSIPDSSWSEWASATVFSQDGSPSVQYDLGMPVARYLQLEVSLPASSKLSEIRTHHLLPNVPPRISDIRVFPIGFDASTQEPPMQQNIDFERAIRASDVTNLISGPGPRTQLRRRPETGLYTILWRAEDANEDNLLFSVYLKSATSADWTLLGADLDSPYYLLNSRGLPDGHYQIKIQVSDHLSNPAGNGLKGHAQSSLFLVDNSPPSITETSRSVENGVLTIAFDASDSFSNLRSAIVSLNGGKPVALLPDDAIWDSRKEGITFVSPKLSAGNHSLLLEVEDDSGNKSVIVINFTID